MLDLFDVLVFRDTTTVVERVTILLLRNTSVRMHQNVSGKKSMMYKKENHITDLTFFLLLCIYRVFENHQKLSHLNFRA